MVDGIAARERSSKRLTGLPSQGMALGTSLARRIATAAAHDASRRGLWTPVAFGAGAALYLTAKSEPAPWLAPLVLVIAAAIAHKFLQWRHAAAGVAILAAGFGMADLRAFSVAGPTLRAETGFVTITGSLVAVDEAPKLRRLIVEVESIERLAPDATPRRIRLSWRGKEFAARPGDIVSLRASLSPPPPPVAPGGFDFARQLYFQRIGAVGFMVAPPTVTQSGQQDWRARVAAVAEEARIVLARRIIAKAPGEGGAIVAAVITGKREAISEEAEAALRDSGLAHLLAISGLHMGLATGLIFFAVRGGLALNETLALKYPIKKWAATAALFSGAGYLLLSGGAWSAQRAFIMSAIMFAAILVDRRALSLRNVAIAALIILAMTPEAVLHPGFQMSFAAVTALIAAYEWASRRADPNRSFSWPARFRRYVVGIAATDTIAALATAPYSLYHFNRAANFGLPANVISIPVMGFWVMPAAIIALLLMPIGLDGPAWRISAAGVDLILLIAGWTSHLPGAVSVIAHWPGAALATVSLGGLWLCLMNANWRIAGLVAFPVAAVMAVIEPDPEIFFPATGDNAGALVNIDGRQTLAVFDRRRSRFAARAWMEFAGVDVANMNPQRLSDFGVCDAAGCAVLVHDTRLAVSSDRGGLDDDCARAEIVIALFPVDHNARRSCAAMLIDRRAAWADGAHTVAIGRNGQYVMRTTRELRGDRPWTGSEAR
jgi:competence protein ComEC